MADVADVVIDMMFDGVSADGVSFDIHLQIYKPVQVGPEEWTCALSLKGIRRRIRAQGGADPLFALFLSMRLAYDLLKHVVDTGGKVRFRGDDYCFDAFPGFLNTT